MLLLIPPDLASLLQLSAQVEPACKRLLSAILPTFVSRETVAMPNERIEVTFAQNAWTGRWLPDGRGDLQHSTWRCTLTLAVYTVRKRQNADGTVNVTDLHPSVCRRIRGALAVAIRDPRFLPWHCIAELNELAGTESVDSGEDSDVSALKFDALITVRSDAMAAVNGPQ